jgi:hypothetical protein
MGARKQVGIGLSYRPTRLHSLGFLMFKNTISGIDFKEYATNSGSGSCYDAWFIEILMMGGGGGGGAFTVL